MQKCLQKQQGMTGLGWLMVLFLLGFFTLLLFKLAPSYLENYSVKSVLNSLEDEPLITTKPVREVQKMIMARLNTNGVRSLKSEAIKIEQSPGLLKVSITYDVQKHLLGNVDVLLRFDNKVELVGH